MVTQGDERLLGSDLPTLVKQRYVGYVAVIAALCGAIWVDWNFVSGMFEHRRMKSWPQTEAIVQEIGLVEHYEKVRYGSVGDHQLAVRFTFVVDGREYEGTRYGYGRLYSLDEAQRIAVAHTVGTQVPVFYDPGNPTNAVLNRDSGPHSADFPLLLAVNAVFLLFTWIVVKVEMFIWKHQPRKRKKSSKKRRDTGGSGPARRSRKSFEY